MDLNEYDDIELEEIRQSIDVELEKRRVAASAATTIAVVARQAKAAGVGNDELRVALEIALEPPATPEPPAEEPEPVDESPTEEPEPVTEPEPISDPPTEEPTPEG